MLMVIIPSDLEMIKHYSDVVDYNALDPVKRKAMDIFSTTLVHPERLRIRVAAGGGTAAVLDFLDYDFMLAFNVESLGTKNLVADAMYREIMAKTELANKFQSGKFYSRLGQDVVAMAVTDIIAVGADPIAYADIIASGNSKWFADKERVNSLLEGYRAAADRTECAIPQGETPELPDLMTLDSLGLFGGAVGIIRPKTRFIDGHKIADGDVIYGFPSYGICANGVSKARKIVELLPESYFTRISDGRTLGEALLEPTPIWVRPIADLLEAGVDIHYISPITGHGWRKLSRAPFPFKYVVDSLPDPPEVFRFLIENGQRLGFDMSDRENYQVWNMGVFLTLIAPSSAEAVITNEMSKHGCNVHVLGHVEKGKREVIIKPKNITYEAGE